MPSVSITNAFDITDLDIDVSLSLSGFSDSCDGTYTKTASKTWQWSGGDREIVWHDGTTDSPIERSRWELRSIATPANVYFLEAVTSATGHPIDVTWNEGGAASSPSTIGTVTAAANQDIAGSIDIRSFTNLTALNHTHFGLTGLTGNIFSEIITYVNLSGNSISSPFNIIPLSAIHQELLLSGNSFYGRIKRIPSTLKFLDISDNDIYGSIPPLSGNTVIEKFIASHTDSPKTSELRGNLPNLSGCTNLTHFNVSGNKLRGIDINFEVPDSILLFDVSDNELTLNTIKLVLRAFNETFFVASPQIDVTGEGRVINVSSNTYEVDDDSPRDSYIDDYITNLTSLGWTITI